MRDYLIVGALIFFSFFAAAKLSDIGATHPSTAHADTVNLKLHGPHLRDHDKKLIHKDFKPSKE